MSTSSGCARCRGVGMMVRPLVMCRALKDALFICEEHLQHYVWDRACWLCLGTGKADVFTRMWRWMRGKLLRK